MQAGAPACSSLRSTQRKSEVEPSGGAKKQREPHSRQLGWRPARREREEEGGGGCQREARGACCRNVHSLLQLQYRVKLKPTYEAVGTARVAAAFHRKPLNRATMRVAAA